MKLYKYTVSGRGKLPIDMLRYDRAAPFKQEDVGRLEAALGLHLPESMHDSHSITFISHRPPTPARWQSFLWNVSTVERA